MSTWSDAFSKSNIASNSKEADRLLGETNREGLTPIQAGHLMRLHKVIKAFALRMEAADPDCFTMEAVQHFGGLTTGILTNVRNFRSNRNFGHIDNANSQADQILNFGRAWTGGTNPEEVKALPSIANDLINQAREEVASVNKTAEETKSALNGLRGSIVASEKKVAELGQTIDQQKGRLDTAIAEFQKQFSDTESKRVAAAAAQLATFLDDQAKALRAIDERGRAATNEMTTEAGKAFDSYLAQLRSELTEAIKLRQTSAEEVATRKGQIDMIFGAIGSSSMSGRFAQSANADRSAADLFRWIAIGLMGVMLGAAVATYIYSLYHPEGEWRIFALRLSLSVIVLIPAIYAAQESSRHRRREQQHRKVEVELASIDAYLALLPKDKADELKAKLTDRFFGRDDVPEKSDEVTKHALFEILKDVVNNLTKAK